LRRVRKKVKLYSRNRALVRITHPLKEIKVELQTQMTKEKKDAARGKRAATSARGAIIT